MSLKILIFYFFSSIFFLTNNLFASHVTVVDGDTIKLGDIKIRFSGIDAPESYFFGKKQICTLNTVDIFCGILSKDKLFEKIGNRSIDCKIEKNIAQR